MPYKSWAQAAKFHAMLKRGEISASTVKEFDNASRGLNLPRHVGDRAKRSPIATARAKRRRSSPGTTAGG